MQPTKITRTTHPHCRFTTTRKMSNSYAIQQKIREITHFCVISPFLHFERKTRLEPAKRAVARAFLLTPPNPLTGGIVGSLVASLVFLSKPNLPTYGKFRKGYDKK